MKGRAFMAALAAVSLATSSAMAGNKDYAIQGYSLPADKPVTIVVMRPDVEVGLLQAGGLPEPNADWTRSAREHLQSAIEANQKARRIDVRTFDAAEGEAVQLIGDYEALHRAVADSILLFAYGSKLPSKKIPGGKGDGKYRFDWTMGPGTQRIGDLSGGNYALFLFTRDNFASAGRQAMQVMGLLGCVVGFCTIVGGGQHVSYASLVELSSGNIVWFNIQRGSKGDIREKEGAQGLIDALLASMPTRPGEGEKVAAK
jgi:hypothetical protein